MGGFIAQAFALKHANRIDKLVLLSTDSRGTEADLALPDVWSELLDTSGTPNEQARRLLFLLFPNDVAESFETSRQGPADNRGTFGIQMTELRFSLRSHM
jgi:pimeloyl-ACP methyl ester carboxylesterase